MPREDANCNTALGLVEPSAHEASFRRMHVHYLAVFEIRDLLEFVAIRPEVSAEKSSLFLG
jgi:hypothetical protein